MQVVLVMFRGEGDRRSFSIARDVTVIGRRNDCDLSIPVGDVSRKHCRIIKTEGEVKIEDLGSSNGTYVNGQRVQEAVLNPGDWIQVGPVQFCVQIEGVPSDEDLASRSANQADETSAGLMIHEDLDQPAASPGPSSADALDSDMAMPTGDATVEEAPLEEVPLEEAPEPAASSDEVLELEEVKDAEVASDELEEIVDEHAPAEDADAEIIDFNPDPSEKH